MTPDLLIGLVAVAIGAGLLVVGLPNRLGESPRFLQPYAVSMLYSTAVLIFLRNWDRRASRLGRNDGRVDGGAGYR
jgi:hypothetical protein